MLKFEKLWFREREREVIRDAFAEVISDFKYTVYACAICSNHAHLVVRRHKDDATLIWDTFADASADRMRSKDVVVEGHPVWADRPYVVFISDPDRVRACSDYVVENPSKEGLPAQRYDFVVPYDGWPFHQRTGK